MTYKAADVDVDELNEMELAIFDKNGAVTMGTLKYYNMLTMELDRINIHYRVRLPLSHCCCHTIIKIVIMPINFLWQNKMINFFYHSFSCKYFIMRMIIYFLIELLNRNTKYQKQKKNQIDASRLFINT